MIVVVGEPLFESRFQPLRCQGCQEPGQREVPVRLRFRFKKGERELLEAASKLSARVDRW
jgi:hypothetical protein